MGWCTALILQGSLLWIELEIYGEESKPDSGDEGLTPNMPRCLRVLSDQSDVWRLYEASKKSWRYRKCEGTR